jgi:hypothetical protein
VWDVLTTYEYSGVTTDRPAVTTRRLPPAVLGLDYRAELGSINTDEQAPWQAEGLPRGLQVADGAIAGTPAEAGTARVTLAKGDARRTLRLIVSPDTPPEVRTTALPQTAMDEHVLLPLESGGGVGRLTWSVAEGALPHGIMLTPQGTLIGTPGEQGTFSATLGVTDSDPRGGRTAARPLTWQIGPPGPETALVPYVKLARGAFKADGKLDEAFWKDVPFSPVGDGPARLGLAWTDHALLVALKAPAGKAVHVYVDGRHNQEVMYNADDSHLVVPRRGRATFVRTHDPWWFARTATAEATDEGWVAEMQLGVAYFHGQGAHVLFGEKAVYGFDVAVEGEDGERAFWRGDPQNDEDTSGFGTIVLVKHKDAPEK